MRRTDVQLRDKSIIDLEGVRYTACPPGNNDWMIRASRISIDQETRIGTGRDVRLDFKGATILYTPWISFPVGDERKSGLLFPTIGSSSKTGTQVAVPYYWNIAPNYDATITTRYFSSRGLRLDPEYRYLTERSEGILNVEYLFDDQEAGGSRSLVDLRSVTHLQPTTRLLVDAAHASDNRYFEDFGVGFEGTSVTYLDRLAEARHDSTHWSVAGRVQDYQILDPELPADEEPYTILPQVAAVGRWRDVAPGLGATLRAEATNFDRDTGVYGLRLDVEPSLDWRAEARGTYVAASAAWRATSYSLSNTEPAVDESPFREVPTLSLDSGLVLERAAGRRGDRLQTLEPRALYLYVPYRDQDELPVFDTGLPDLNLVQLFRTNRYVGADRVSDANQLSLGLTSRLLDAAGGRQYLSATLGQAYYFENPRVRLPDEPVRDAEHLRPDRAARAVGLQELERRGSATSGTPRHAQSERSRGPPAVPASRRTGRQPGLPLPARAARAGRRVGGLADRRAAGAATVAGSTRWRGRRRSTASPASNTAPAAGRCASWRAVSSAAAPATPTPPSTCSWN